MKPKIFFECTVCGFQNPKNFGKCPQCNHWNSMIAVSPSEEAPGSDEPVTDPVKLSEIRELDVERVFTGIDEFDRVLGGGMVPDSVVLIGGEPGVGKSTLLLEVSAKLAAGGNKILYYSGEESATQIKSRSLRLGIDTENISLLTMGSLENLKRAALDMKPRVLIVDSIQTIPSKNHASFSGSLSAMRYATSEIIELGKKNNITVFIIGHITKEGQIAGPKTLEHMVDAVLYFQGELKSDLRILRAEKNRFGAVNEIGVFQMTSSGLKDVSDPSLIFLQHRETTEPGVSIFPAMNGLRSVLIEIQSLVTESPFVGNPRRISVGYDGYRMSMLISVIEKKLKIPFYKSDVFLNITGGMQLRDTAADLAVVGALISNHKNITIPGNVIIIGEVGLTGEIRPVSFIKNRIMEAQRHGFTTMIIPEAQSDLPDIPKISITPIRNIYDFYQIIKQK